MRKIFFYCFLLFWYQSTLAFFAPSPVFERIDKKVHISVTDDGTQIEVLETIKNNSDVPQKFRYLSPLSRAKDLKFFVEAEAIPFKILEEYERLEFLFQQAEKNKESRFFRLAQKKWPQTMVSDYFDIPAHASVEIKFKYQKNLDFVHDFFFSEIFLNDEIKTQNMEIVLNLDRAQNIFHFLPIFSSSKQALRENKQITWIWKETAVIPRENFVFFFSEVQDPVLKFNAFEATYSMFFPQPQKFVPQNLLILVDQSGSLYGSAWNRIGDILQDFLDHIDDKTKVKFVFFSEADSEALNAEFEPVSQKLKKLVFETFEGKKPTGKTSFEPIFSNLEQETAKNLGILLIGDFANFTLSESQMTQIQEKNIPFFTLDFSDTPNDVDLLTQLSGGQSQYLFKTPTSFIESAEFWEKWNRLIVPIHRNTWLEKYPQETEMLPVIQKSISPHVSPLLVSRNFEAEKTVQSDLERFIPRLWASRKIAQILKQSGLNIDKKIPSQTIDAILSIARTFGIKTDFFDESTNNSTLEKTLKTLDRKTLWRKILALESAKNIKPMSSAQWVKHIPFYQTENRWQAFNFHQNNDPEKLIQIAPFSEAQKFLFLKFPEIFAEAFGLGEEVNFCYQNYRCLSLQKDARTEKKTSDLFFWKNHHPHHWANNYLQTLADKNILSVSDDGNAYPEQKISRGEFVRLVSLYFYPEQWTSVENVEPFIDLDPDTDLAKMAGLLKEKEIIRGFGDQTFRPHQNLTRAEAVKILLAIKGVVPPENWQAPKELPFPDINGWEKFWVLKASQLKMVQGYPDGRFWPQRHVTRAQAAKLLVEVDQ